MPARPAVVPSLLRTIACAVACLALGAFAGCATAPEAQGPVAQAPQPEIPDAVKALLDDASYPKPAGLTLAQDVFAISPAMRAYLRDTIDAQLHHDGLREGLIKALHAKDQLRLDYEASVTRTAAQTFDSRSGNCLSLTLMTAALAKELDLPVVYQSVWGEELWTRSSDIYFLSNHVNVSLGRRMGAMTSRYDASVMMTVDFLPAQDIIGQRRQVIPESTVLAMFFNNRAAESLAANDVNAAYWYAREAIRQDPGFLGALNTLAVVDMHHGNAKLAEATLRYAQVREPSNPLVIANLAQALREQGRDTDARVFDAQLARIEPVAPFKYFNAGVAAMDRADYALAREMFTKELEREPDYHEFQYWLAIADFKLGYLEEARNHMALAVQDSVTRGERALYSAKLDKLRAVGGQR